MPFGLLAICTYLVHLYKDRHHTLLHPGVVVTRERGRGLGSLRAHSPGVRFSVTARPHSPARSRRGCEGLGGTVVAFLSPGREPFSDVERSSRMIQRSKITMIFLKPSQNVSWGKKMYGAPCPRHWAPCPRLFILSKRRRSAPNHSAFPVFLLN